MEPAAAPGGAPQRPPSSGRPARGVSKELGPSGISRGHKGKSCPSWSQACPELAPATHNSHPPWKAGENLHRGHHASSLWASLSPVPLRLHLPPRVLSSLATVFGFREENVEQARLLNSHLTWKSYAFVFSSFSFLSSFSYAFLFSFSCVSILRSWSCSHRHLTLNPSVIVLIFVS